MRYTQVLILKFGLSALNKFTVVIYISENLTSNYLYIQ